MSASKVLDSEVRIGHSLNCDEEKFVKIRRGNIWQSLEKLGIHCSQDKVPNIALLGSGGGQRAMVSLLGCLDQLDGAGLLDCFLYLSGVSGSTWCMALLYNETDWSADLQTVKGEIVNKISGSPVGWPDVIAKMREFYINKENFSLTDVWAALVVTTFVKETDFGPLPNLMEKHIKDPFPIFNMVDKQWKQSEQCKKKKKGDPWFEVSPYETGYSVIGAFVKTDSFGSQFDKGCKIKTQPEMDMLYLQGLCSSALADGPEIIKWIWTKIKGATALKEIVHPKTENLD